MSHLIVKGRRRSEKVLERKRRRGAGPVDEPQEEALLRVAQNKFRMLRRSVAAAWRKFDRVSALEAGWPSVFEKEKEEAGKRAEEIQARALAYGRSRGLAIG